MANWVMLFTAILLFFVAGYFLFSYLRDRHARRTFFSKKKKH